jgi:gamma-glutamyltranspeptidase/glutathione hydrolase
MRIERVEKKEQSKKIFSDFSFLQNKRFDMYCIRKNHIIKFAATQENFAMQRIKLFVSFSITALIAMTFCQPQRSASHAPHEVAHGSGFYQFTAETKPAENDYERKATFAKGGMVVSAHPEASRIGAEILKQGGNAIDATIAVKFALAVVFPSAGNIAGGGFMIYRDNKGEIFALDFREKAPAAASRDMYLDANGNVIPNLSWLGRLACGVPGTVDAMQQAHERFGKLPWKKLVQPAIDIAKKGVVLTEKEALGLNRAQADFKTQNADSPYKYLENDKGWKTGDIVYYKDLAATLERIRDKKRAGFYEGKTAELFLAEMKRGGGIITQKDLDDYRSIWRKPMKTPYKNYTMIGMPPPSSGGIAIAQLLQIMSGHPINEWGFHSKKTVHLMIEAERRVYADRSKHLGDPDFVKIPVQGLLDAQYLRQRMSDFSWDTASESKNIAGGTPMKESTETTHFSVIDKDGNAVAVTTTINNSYGSRAFVQGGGFLLNNEMDDFSAKPGTPNAYGLVGAEANAIQANKRMLSSMSPTIVEKDGQLYMTLGTPGGSTIITSVFQTILNVLEHGMDMQQAVNAKRFHHQWLPDRTVFEPNGLPQAVVDSLLDKGHNLEEQTNTIGRVDGIRKLADGTLEGGADPRGDDAAIGHD